MQLRAAAGKVHIAEAFMVRFHPQWLRARELVHEGRIGGLRTVHRSEASGRWEAIAPA